MKNMGLWVRAHATVKNMGSMGDSDAEKGGLLSLTYASPPEWDCPPPGIETHGKLSGVFPYMESFIVDQATHTLRSAAILFLRDRGERDSV